MPSRAKVVKSEESNGSFKVIVKVRGVATADFSSAVARRAKFAAARHVGILKDYVPSKLNDLGDTEIQTLMEGKYFAEIVERREIDDSGFVSEKMKNMFRTQQTVLYAIKVDK